MPDTAAHAHPAGGNRLSREPSPYLRQHADQPVDWFPWGEEACAGARATDRPIFLSIGYSTCHWCHVMARESFDDPDIAAILNAHFVPVKVDREERPDLDQVYMAFVQATTGSGGWPMSVWLTPQLEPFFGGTYFPPDDRWGRHGFKSILLNIAATWRQERERIAAAAGTTMRHMRQLSVVCSRHATTPAEILLEQGFQQLQDAHDSHHGGFGDAPKFPRPANLNFLLRYHALNRHQNALDMVHSTLRKMADGGIHDHLGGGFHRYAVDAAWHVPHFEKMLYDQAQLASTCLETFQATRDHALADVARDTLDYVLHDLAGPDGQIFSAEDADSPLPENPAVHAEGAFYLWTQTEIVAAIGPDDARVFNFHYGVQADGNVATDPHGEFTGKNILVVRQPLATTAREFGITPEAAGSLLARSRSRLNEIRQLRPRPQLDDKVLTAWNGLMISAFARAHQVLSEPRYLAAAQRIATFIRTHLIETTNGTPRLLRRHHGDNSAIDAFLDDHAFLVQGLLDLYETSFKTPHLALAIALQNAQDERFWDDADGAYFTTSGHDPSVILRLKDDHDGAEPAGNSVAAMNLIRLAQMTGNDDFAVRAERLFAAFAGFLRHAPGAMPQMLAANACRQGRNPLIVIAGQPGAPDTIALLHEIHARFIPDKSILLVTAGQAQTELAKLTTLAQDKTMLHGKATAYFCANRTCQPPVTDPRALAQMLAPAG